MAKKKGKLLIGNSLVIDDVKDLQDKFNAVLASSSALTIKSEEISQIDLAGIQLLYNLKNRAIAEGKKIEYKMKIDEDQRALLEKNGFTEIIQTVFS